MNFLTTSGAVEQCFYDLGCNLRDTQATGEREHEHVVAQFTLSCYTEVQLVS